MNVEPYRQQLYADAAVAALQAASLQHLGGVGMDEGDMDDRKRSHVMMSGKGRGGAGGMQGDMQTKENCRNQTGFIGVRQRKWGMFAAEIRDGDKRR